MAVHHAVSVPSALTISHRHAADRDLGGASARRCRLDDQHHPLSPAGFARPLVQLPACGRPTPSRAASTWVAARRRAPPECVSFNRPRASGSDDAQRREVEAGLPTPIYVGRKAESTRASARRRANWSSVNACGDVSK